MPMSSPKGVDDMKNNNYICVTKRTYEENAADKFALSVDAAWRCLNALVN
jgi:hypothetical protein